MKIKLFTESAKALAKDILNAVEDETIKTWVLKKDNNGSNFLTHKPEQWIDKALFGFKPETDKLVIFLTWWKDKEPTEDVKGYYVGRLTEILLVNFSNKFDKFEIEK